MDFDEMINDPELEELADRIEELGGENASEDTRENA